MDQLFGTAATAAGVFIGTNIDDLIVLTVLFLSYRATASPQPWKIWTGQYLGIGALILVCALAAAGLTIVPDRWIGLLGLVPMALGVRGLIQAWRGGDEAAPAVATTVLAIAGVTIANGADNISVYTPLFRTIGAGNSAATVAVFGILTAGWCLAGTWLASHRKVIAVIEKFGHWLVPAVFITIGAVIIAESGVLTRLF